MQNFLLNDSHRRFVSATAQMIFSAQPFWPFVCMFQMEVIRANDKRATRNVLAQSIRRRLLALDKLAQFTLAIHEALVKAGERPVTAHVPAQQPNRRHIVHSIARCLSIQNARA